MSKPPHDSHPSRSQRRPAQSRARRSRPASGAAADSPSSQSISTAEVLSMVRRWWWQCGLIGAVLAAGTASIVWWTFVPTYEASAWLEIKSQSPYIAFPDRDGSHAFSQTQLETIRSAIVLSRVASRPEIAQCPENSAGLPPEQWLKKGLGVRYVGQSELCEVTFRSKDPQAAALVANAVATEYLALHQDHSSEQTERIIKLLNEQQRERKADVEALRESVRTLVKKTTGHDPVLLGGDHKSAVHRNPFAEAEEQRIAAEVKEALLDAELKALEAGVAANEVEIPTADLHETLNSHPDVQRMRQHVAILHGHASEYKRVSALGANDPKAARKAKEAEEVEAALDKRLSDLEPLIRKEMEKSLRAAQQQTIGEVRLQRERASIVRKEWERRAAEQRKELEKHGDEALTLEFVRGDLERSEQVRSRIADRIMALQTEKLAPTRATSRKEAVVPLHPVEKAPFKKMGMAGLGAFCIPFGLAFLWERWMRRISDGPRVMRESNLPVLGEIAALPSRMNSFEDRGSGLRDRVTFEESIDALRVALTLSRGLQDVQTLAITSAVSREGKTSLASALAISLSRSFHESVLLIDGDMRAPDLHEMFDAPLAPGLAEVLGRECPLDEALIHNAADGVDLLPAGQLAANPHALLRNGAFGALLAEVGPRYRYIVVDSPPVLSASEAAVIANACDGVVICTRCDFSRGYQLRAASERLATAGARLLGAVINAVPTRIWAYRYGGYGYGWERYAMRGGAARSLPTLKEPPVGFDEPPATEGSAE